MENYDADYSNGSTNAFAEQASPQTSSEALALTQTTLEGNEKLLSKKEIRKKRRTEKKAARKEKWANMSTGKKICRISLRVPMCVVTLAILFCGIFCAINNFGNDHLVPRPTPPYGGAWADDEDFVFLDEYESYGYYNDFIRVCFDRHASDEDIAVALASVNGTIVEKRNLYGDYKVQVEPREYEELQALCDEISEFECVLSAEIIMDWAVILN